MSPTGSPTSGGKSMKRVILSYTIKNGELETAVVYPDLAAWKRNILRWTPKGRDKKWDLFRTLVSHAQTMGEVRDICILMECSGRRKWVEVA